MNDSTRFYGGLLDLARRRIALIFGSASVRTDRVYDPTKGAGGDGRTCSKCRKVSRSDARVCGSCGTLLRMTP